MFDNIENKLQLFAKGSCWVGIILCVILGIALIPTVGPVEGLVIAAGGSLLSWILGIYSYAIGQITEDIRQIRYATLYTLQELREQKTNTNAPAAQAPLQAAAQAPKKVCPHCGAKNNMSNTTCFACNGELD